MKCPDCGKRMLVVDTGETSQGTRRRLKCPEGHNHTSLEILVGPVGQGHNMPVVTIAERTAKGGARRRKNGKN